MGCTTSKASAKGGSSQAQARFKENPGSTSVSFAVTPGMHIHTQAGHLSDRYQRVKKLGAGAYGDVLLCKDKRTGESKAIKIIKRSACKPLAEGQMLEEVAVLKKLDHPHIMKLYDFFEDKKYYYLVMELYAGGELFDEIITRQKFSERDAAQVLRQILSGCVYLHELGIVHRDLKPENLLLESKSELHVRIVDFGLSVGHDGKPLQERLGTAYYVAPEVLRKRYDEKVDVWSCGVILYILLCGYPPFGGKTDQDILRKVEKGKYSFDPQDWAHVSEDAMHLVRGMLTFDPSKRLAARQALDHPWVRAAANRDALPKAALSGAVSNMLAFQSRTKLAQAAWLFLGTQAVASTETQELRAVFMALDKNNDGLLDRAELEQGYSQHLAGTRSGALTGTAEEAVESILEQADLNRDGKISITEFVTAAMSKERLLDLALLGQAFDRFDADRDGKVSKEEIATAFGVSRIKDKYWQAIIAEADVDGDDNISREEFVALMQRLGRPDGVKAA